MIKPEEFEFGVKLHDRSHNGVRPVPILKVPDRFVDPMRPQHDDALVREIQEAIDRWVAIEYNELEDYLEKYGYL